MRIVIVRNYRLEFIMVPIILIIDDNEDDILLTKIALLKIWRDIKPEVAMSGAAGLEILREGKLKPTVVLLDIKMPGMSGIEVLRKIREDDSLKTLLVVILTHSKLESDKEAAMNAGANSFLHKAADLDQFKNSVHYELEYLLNTSLVVDSQTKTNLAD
jgi:CheY-like chemotaxis protein